MFAVLINSSKCMALLNNESQVPTLGISPSVGMPEAVLLIIGFGIFAALLASGFKVIRSRIYLDKVSVCFKFVFNLKRKVEYLNVNYCVKHLVSVYRGSVYLSFTLGTLKNQVALWKQSETLCLVSVFYSHLTS